MANVIATYTSGLVVGSGAVYAFVSHFTEQSHAMSYKLRWASAALREADAAKDKALLVRMNIKPEVLSKYRQFTSHLSETAVPLAKKEWNGMVALAVDRVNTVDASPNRLVSMLQKQLS
ncbi:hypothetical protein IWW37_001738 [Coemansia sp. RSA 2050]|nr:hypothetical protein IWW37_001738 [Coemansia sp. RSA 2050]KAJ2735327.1 hypothetical protein IW152_001707 [Coemansia sp. BCRC 34962]